MTRFLKQPFTAEPWRRTAYVLLAVPAAAIALADGGEAQRRLARALLGREVRRTRLRGLLAVPLGLFALAVTLYGWSIVVLNVGYPLRPLIGMDGSLANAWGGPTLAGAWAFHGIVGGLGILLLMPWILLGLTRLHAGILGQESMYRTVDAA